MLPTWVSPFCTGLVTFSSVCLVALVLSEAIIVTYVTSFVPFTAEVVTCFSLKARLLSAV